LPLKRVLDLDQLEVALETALGEGLSGLGFIVS